SCSSCLLRRPLRSRSPPSPYTTLFRSLQTLKNHLRPTWFQLPEHRTQGRAHDASTNKCDIDGINCLACILSGGHQTLPLRHRIKVINLKARTQHAYLITIRLRVPKSRFSLGNTMNSDSLYLCLWNNYTIGGPIFWEKTLKLLHFPWAKIQTVPGTSRLYWFAISQNR